MIDASQLKDSVEKENDIVTKEIKSNSLKIAPSFKNYKEEYKYTPFLRRIEKNLTVLIPRMILKTMMNTEN